MQYLLLAIALVGLLLWIRSASKKRNRSIELPDDINEQWADFVRDYFKDGRQR